MNLVNILMSQNNLEDFNKQKNMLRIQTSIRMIEKCPIDILMKVYKKISETDPVFQKKKQQHTIIVCSPLITVHGFNIPKQKNTMCHSPKMLNLSQLDLLDASDSDLNLPQSCDDSTSFRSTLK